MVVARLFRPDAAGLCPPADTPERLIDGRPWERLTAKVRPRLAAAEARSPVVDGAPLLDPMIGAGDVPAARDRLPPSRRRAVINTPLTLTLHRTRRGAQTFDPEPVTIAWRRR